MSSFSLQHLAHNHEKRGGDARGADRAQQSEKVRRIALMMPTELIAEVEAYRRHQPDPMPNLSEAIRQLIELGVKASKPGKDKKPK
jgi:hypothetical protein